MGRYLAHSPTDANPLGQPLEEHLILRVSFPTNLENGTVASAGCIMTSANTAKRFSGGLPEVRSVLTIQLPVRC